MRRKGPFLDKTPIWTEWTNTNLIPGYMELDEYFATIDESVRPKGIYAQSKYIIEHLAEVKKFFESKTKKMTKYAFTLTSARPDVTDEEMRQAAYKIMTQTTCPVLQGAAYLEHHESGKPHVHGWYHLEGGTMIYTKIFKRYWSEWDPKTPIGSGFKGGYHSVMASDKYKNYAAADEDKICSIGI